MTERNFIFQSTKKENAERKIAAGNPAKIIKDVSDEMLEWKRRGTGLYKELPVELFATLKPCVPLRSIPSDRPKQQDIYNSWKKHL